VGECGRGTCKCGWVWYEKALKGFVLVEGLGNLCVLPYISCVMIVGISHPQHSWKVYIHATYIPAQYTTEILVVIKSKYQLAIIGHNM
jgi:hypothetical protein